MNEEDQLTNTYKFRNFKEEINGVISNFDKCREWPDLIRVLGALSKCIKKYSKMNILPEKIGIMKRLTQCLNPNLPAGVKMKTIEVYDEILKQVTSKRIAEDISIFSFGILVTFPRANTSIKPSLLDLLENHFLILEKSVLQKCLFGLISCLLGGLEDDESSVLYRKTVRCLEKIHETMQDNTLFWKGVWRSIAQNSSCRKMAFSFVTKWTAKFSQFSMDSFGVENEQLFLEAIYNSLSFPSNHTFTDDQIRTIRSVFDFICIIKFDALPQFFFKSFQDTLPIATQIMKLMLLLYTKADASIMRRILQWIFADLEETETDSNTIFEQYTKPILLETLKQFVAKDMSIDFILEKVPNRVQLLQELLIDILQHKRFDLLQEIPHETLLQQMGEQMDLIYTHNDTLLWLEWSKQMVEWKPFICNHFLAQLRKGPIQQIELLDYLLQNKITIPYGIVLEHNQNNPAIYQWVLEHLQNNCTTLEPIIWQNCFEKSNASKQLLSIRFVMTNSESILGEKTEEEWNLLIDECWQQQWYEPLLQFSKNNSELVNRHVCDKSKPISGNEKELYYFQLTQFYSIIQQQEMDDIFVPLQWQCLRGLNETNQTILLLCRTWLYNSMNQSVVRTICNLLRLPEAEEDYEFTIQVLQVVFQTSSIAELFVEQLRIGNTLYEFFELLTRSFWLQQFAVLQVMNKIIFFAKEFLCTEVVFEFLLQQFQMTLQNEQFVYQLEYLHAMYQVMTFLDVQSRKLLQKWIIEKHTQVKLEETPIGQLWHRHFDTFLQSICRGLLGAAAKHEYMLQCWLQQLNQMIPLFHYKLGAFVRAIIPLFCKLELYTLSASFLQQLIYFCIHNTPTVPFTFQTEEEETTLLREYQNPFYNAQYILLHQCYITLLQIASRHNAIEMMSALIEKYPLYWNYYMAIVRRQQQEKAAEEEATIPLYQIQEWTLQFSSISHLIQLIQICVKRDFEQEFFAAQLQTLFEYLKYFIIMLPKESTPCDLLLQFCKQVHTIVPNYILPLIQQICSKVDLNSHGKQIKEWRQIVLQCMQLNLKLIPQYKINIVFWMETLFQDVELGKQVLNMLWKWFMETKQQHMIELFYHLRFSKWFIHHFVLRRQIWNLFFAITPSSVPLFYFWKQLMVQILYLEPALHKEVFARFQVSASFIGRSQKEAQWKSQLLQKLSFVILCSEYNEYSKYVPLIQEKIMESIKSTNHHSLVIEACLLLFKVCMSKMSEVDFYPMWSILLSEWLKQNSANQKNSSSQDLAEIEEQNVHKQKDLIIVARKYMPNTFSTIQWIFTTEEESEEVYRSKVNECRDEEQLEKEIIWKYFLPQTVV